MFCQEIRHENYIKNKTVHNIENQYLYFFMFGDSELNKYEILLFDFRFCYKIQCLVEKNKKIKSF